MPFSATCCCFLSRFVCYYLLFITHPLHLTHLKMYFIQLITLFYTFSHAFLNDTLMNQTYNKLYIHYVFFNVNTNEKNYNYNEDAKRELQSLFILKMADWLSTVICIFEFIILNFLITCFEWCTVFVFCILFRYELIEAVQLIASELSADSDIDLLVMCATFFNEKSHFEKAVRLLAIARKVSHCIIFLFYWTPLLL